MTWISQILSAFAKPLKWWVVVAPWEQGLRVRLGKKSKELLPGIHFRFPFLDRIFIQSIRLRTINTSNQTISSNDKKVLSISYYIQFSISSIQKLYNHLSNPENMIRGRVEGHVVNFISSRDMEDLTPASVNDYVNNLINDLKDWGLSDIKFQITSYANVKTYRLLMNDYISAGSLWNLEEKENAGEK